MFEKLQGLAQGNLRNSRLYYKIPAVAFIKELLQASSMNDSKLWKQCQEGPMRSFLQTISKWHSWFGAVPCTLFHINKSIILNGISNRHEFFRDYVVGVCTCTKPLHISEAQWECSFCQNFWKLKWRPLASHKTIVANYAFARHFPPRPAPHTIKHSSGDAKSLERIQWTS
jgi:hypothetical protein